MRRATADLIANEIFKAKQTKESIEYNLRIVNTSNINLVMKFNRQLQLETNRIFNLQNR